MRAGRRRLPEPASRVLRAGTVCAVALAALSVAFAGAAPPAPVAAPTAPSGPPTVEVADQAFADDAIAAGATFKVTGSGWQPNTLVQLEVCGAEARSGTSDCAVGQAQIVGTDADGTLRARLAVVVPPSPCPCVVRAFGQTNGQQATTPVIIPGAPEGHAGDGDVAAPALRRVEVHDVVLRGTDDLATWLGRPAKRTLVFEIENTGDVAVLEATVTLTRGDAADPTGFVAPIRLDALAVGERRTITVPIEFDALAFGEQAVRGTVNGLSAPVAFRATTSTHPWLLIGIPIALLLQFVLVFVRNRLRRRLHAGPTAAAEPVDPTDSVLIVVMDLELVAATDDGPLTTHRTEVVRSMAEVRARVAGTHPTDLAGGTVVGLTVMADEDARVGEAYRACEALCDWIESVEPVAGVALRRHPGGVSTAMGSGWGLIPLAAMVRAVPTRVGAPDRAEELQVVDSEPQGPADGVD